MKEGSRAQVGIRMSEEQSAVYAFCTVTGAPPQQAAAFLSLFDGSLENAVSAYLDSATALSLQPPPPPAAVATAVAQPPLLTSATANHSTITSPLDKYMDFKNRIVRSQETILRYEKRRDKLAALENFIDFAAIQRYFMELKEQQSCGDSTEQQSADDVLFMKSLLRWFKLDFFKWCNKPDCESCSEGRGSAMESIGSTPVTEEERRHGASRCELYRCTRCMAECRFARFNDPLHLLRTRRGRCGEWANAFCLLCRALSIDARYVYDFTDHVWVEVYLPSLGRFVHCDPCERALDSPLMYEGGWGKRLTHVIAYSRYGCDDSIARYSRKLEDVADRREDELGVCEADAAAAIAEVNCSLESLFFESIFQRQGSSDSAAYEEGDVFARLLVEEVVGGADVEAIKSAFISCIDKELPVGEVIRRKLLLREELLSLRTAAPAELGDEERRGRQTGDVEWRRARGELGMAYTADGSYRRVRRCLVTSSSSSSDSHSSGRELVGISSFAASDTEEDIIRHCSEVLTGGSCSILVSERGGEGRVAALFANTEQSCLEIIPEDSENDFLSEGSSVPATCASEAGYSAIDSPLQTSAEGTARLLYLTLGGGHHGDTRPFDGVVELLALAQALGNGMGVTPEVSLITLLESVRVCEIAVMADSSFCYGCQVTYAVGGATIPTASSVSSAHASSYIAKSITIQPEESIRRITVNSGSLVDSIVIKTSLGRSLSAGGGGGHNERVIDVEDGFFSDKKFLGFWGGLGGHLHNFGAVFLCKTASGDRSAFDLTEELSAVLGAISLSAVLKLKSYSAGRLISLTVQCMRLGERETVRRAVRAVVAYLVNILKHPQDAKYKSIRLNNTYLRKHVLVVNGALRLLLEGPVRFALCEAEFALKFSADQEAPSINSYIIYLTNVFNL